MAENKIYVPKCSAKKVEFQSGGSVLKLGIHAETVIAFLKEHANEKGYVNLGISARRETGQYGDTHCVWLDTWKPNQNKPAQRREEPEQQGTSRDSGEEVPF